MEKLSIINVNDEKGIVIDSREIAELTNKRHDIVLRDIEVQIGKLGGLHRFEDTYIHPQNK